MTFLLPVHSPPIDGHDLDWEPAEDMRPYWMLDNRHTGAPRIYDAMGGRYHGTHDATWKATTRGDVLDFDGNAADVPDFVRPNTDGFSVVFRYLWRTAVFSRGQWLASQRPVTSGAENQWQFYANLTTPGSLRFSVFESAGSLVDIGTTGCVANTIYHVVGAAQANGNVCLYVDGKSVDSAAIGSLQSSTAQLMRFGRESPTFGSTPRVLDGQMDSLAFCDWALSADEAWDVYASQIDGGPGLFARSSMLQPMQKVIPQVGEILGSMTIGRRLGGTINVNRRLGGEVDASRRLGGNVRV